MSNSPGNSDWNDLRSEASPRVTVVMAAWNAMPWLPDAVQSVIDQTLTEWRMIIVDDGSTDGTGPWLDALQDSRIHIIHQENAGQQHAANRAIRLAETDLIVRFDADDICLPDRLKKQVTFMEQHPEVALMGGQFRYLGDAGIGPSSCLPTDHETIFQELLHNRHAICNSMTILRKSVFLKVGGYWEHDISEDWDLFLRVGEIAKLANLPDVIGLMRFHVGSINGKRMVESQLHNEYACELARRRMQNADAISLNEFKKSHRLGRWPGSWLFRADCYAVAQYRVAMGDMLNRRRVRGALRMVWSMVCSPMRTVRRVGRIITNRG